MRQAQLQETCHGGCRMLLLHLGLQDKVILHQLELELSHIWRTQHLAIQSHHNTNTTTGYPELSRDRTQIRTPTGVSLLVALGGNQHRYQHTHGNSPTYRHTEHLCLPTPSSIRPICGTPDMWRSWKLLTKLSLQHGEKACPLIHRIHLHYQQVPAI
jgi:hypothetical protein